MGGTFFRSLATRSGWFSLQTPSFDLLFRVALVAAILAAYSPSFRHPPRADQWCFLNDTMSHFRVLDVIESTYSYTRTRQTLPGDTDLYRPVLFTLLAAERALLEGDLRHTQMLGIFLHCGVCFLLLSLLKRIESITWNARQSQNAEVMPEPARSYLPYAMTAFFALSPAIQEMIIWAHLHGYILFLVFVLGSANLLVKHVSGPRAGELLCPNLWGAWLLALASAFTYELGQLYAVLVGLFLASTVVPRKGLIRAATLFAIFASVLVIYQAANKHDLRLHRGEYSPDNHRIKIRELALTSATVTHTVRFTLYTALQPYYPSLTRSWTQGDRLHVAEAFWYDPLLESFSFREAGSLLVFGLFTCFGIMGLWGLLRERGRLPLLIHLLALGIYAAYGAMNILGRMNMRPGTQCLCSNSYYTYTGFLFTAIAMFTLLQGVSRHKGLLTTLAWKAMLLGLVAVTIYGGFKVRAVNVRLADMMKGMSAPIRAAHKFVRQHRHEPDFSMAIDYRTSDPVPGRYGKAVTDIIFAQWIAPNPKYKIAIRHRAPVVLLVRSPGKDEG